MTLSQDKICQHQWSFHASNTSRNLNQLKYKLILLNLNNKLSRLFIVNSISLLDHCAVVESFCYTVVLFSSLVHWLCHEIPRNMNTDRDFTRFFLEQVYILFTSASVSCVCAFSFQSLVTFTSSLELPMCGLPFPP